LKTHSIGERERLKYQAENGKSKNGNRLDNHATRSTLVISKMTLLQQQNRERDQRNETLRAKARERLRTVLRQLVPVDRVVVFGSLTKPHRFTDTSDIDIALEVEPAGTSLYQLTALLAEEMGRPVASFFCPNAVSGIALREKAKHGCRRFDHFAQGNGSGLRGGA
jgi:predicted nucleotidyltransferase